MSLSISATLPAEPPPAPAATPTATAHTTAPQIPDDTASVSEAAQVSQLSLEGQNPSQIAASLGIPVSSVNLDLGIAASASA